MPDANHVQSGWQGCPGLYLALLRADRLLPNRYPLPLQVEQPHLAIGRNTGDHKAAVGAGIGIEQFGWSLGRIITEIFFGMARQRPGTGFYFWVQAVCRNDLLALAGTLPQQPTNRLATILKDHYGRKRRFY